MTKPDLKVAILVDRGEVPRFGLDALDELDCCDEISVFSCTDTRLARKPLRHGAYYALNLERRGLQMEDFSHVPEGFARTCSFATLGGRTA